jgi:tetratricopeptide (TPR) repeat protein
MKKILLSILIVGSATLANAQKSEVTEAKKKWNIFTLTGTAQPLAKQLASLNAGLVNTDNAIANEKSKIMPDAWSYRALFSSSIAVADTLNEDNSIAKQKIAEEAVAKAKELDTKGEEKDNIVNAELNIRNSILVRGMKAYNKKDYENALKGFEQLLALNPQDTAMYLNAGVTAKLLNKYPESIGYFKKVIGFNSPDSKDLYSEIINMTLVTLKDTVGAMGLITEAMAKYPDDPNFVGSQTDIYIAQGNIVKSQESLSKLIAKDASKPVYHYLMGDTYYKQALAIQDDRKKLDAKKTKEFDALTAKMTGLIDQSLPFYKKAIEIDAKFVPALESLKQIYAFKNDNTNYEAIKKQLDAIPATN